MPEPRSTSRPAIHNILIVCAIALLAGSLYWHNRPTPDGSPTLKSLSNMRNLHLLLLQFEQETNTELDLLQWKNQLEQHFDDQPFGTDRPHLWPPRDFWGSPLIVRRDPTSIQILSAGINGTFENGTGDDLIWPAQ